MKRLVAVFGALVLAGGLAFAFSMIDPTNSGATASAVRTCGGGSLYLNAYEKRTLQLHNGARTSRGLGPLCVSSKLTRAARAHSQEMMDRDYLSHNSYNGETYDARLRRFGYTRLPSGENISWGSGSYGSPNSRFNFWMNSSPHRANILSGRYDQVGIGTASGTFQGYGGAVTYTVDFGNRP